MKSRVFKKGTATAEMNMTPLIDVTFQLIIFFLLTNTIASEEAVKMIVPQLTGPKTRELGDVARVVVNLVPQDYGETQRLRSGGSYLDVEEGTVKAIKVGLTYYTVDQLDEVTRALQDRVRQFNDASKDPAASLEVVLRADSALYYDQVQPVMSAITRAGISKVNLVAYLPGEKP